MHKHQDWRYIDERSYFRIRSVINKRSEDYFIFTFYKGLYVQTYTWKIITLKSKWGLFCDFRKSYFTAGIQLWSLDWNMKSLKGFAGFLKYYM